MTSFHRFLMALGALTRCHQLPERSFFWRGRQFPVCARCTGLFAGFLLGLCAGLLFGAGLPIYIATGVAVTAMAVDGFGQHFGAWVSTNPRRVITGFLCGFFLLWALAGWLW
ncbi:MAG: DUF2085 domain-containing protein [Clostridia bacterium]|nr:DUF2085 domain-containing protein [Clostridia bacterium]